MTGKGHRVEDIQMEGPPSQAGGIALGDFAVALRNLVINADTAFAVGKNSLVRENVVGASGHAVLAGENAIIDSNTFDGGGAQASIKAGHGSIVTGNIAGGNDGGIDAGSFCLVRENTVRNTGDFGIGAGEGSVVSGNRVNQVGHGPGVSAGIGVAVIGNAISHCGEGVLTNNGSSVSDNAVTNCTGLGLHLAANAGYDHNVLVGNNGGGVQVSGGVQTDKNICGSGLC